VRHSEQQDTHGWSTGLSTFNRWPFGVRRSFGHTDIARPGHIRCWCLTCRRVGVLWRPLRLRAFFWTTPAPPGWLPDPPL